ncbi:MAG: transporter, partial [Myxococcales bacterium]
MNSRLGRGAPAALVLAVALLAPGLLHAQAQAGEQAGQQPGQVDAQAFHPAPDRAGDFLTAHSGRLLPAHGFSGGVLAHYARRPLVLRRPERLSPAYAGPYSGDVVTDRAVLHGLFAYGLTDWLQLGADVPVVLTQSGDDRTGLSDPGEVSRAAGLGDLRLLAKLRLFDHPAPAGASAFHLALVADAGLPTGDAARYQGGTTRLAPTLAAQWRSDFGARVAGNLGYAWRADEASFGETRVEGGPSWALAVALPVWGRREARVEFLGEVAGELTTELQ